MAHMYHHHAATHARRGGTAYPSENLLNEPVLWRCLLLAALTYLVWSEKISIVLDFSPRGPAKSVENTARSKVRAALLSDVTPVQQDTKPARKRAQVVLPPGSAGHFVFALDPEFADRNGTDAAQVSISETQCREYIERFAPVAVAEMQKFGIPASIAIAQGLLESNAGDRKLVRNTNNHFGIKCFSNKCRKGHCVNFTDDSHKDFFVRYDNVWSSYRAHSTFLKNSRRYGHLFRLSPTNYQAWAHGLERAGYATDKQYAEKLIALIENLNLHTFDRGTP
ncbi:MAG: glucosaminidase domain-containing protein [Lewinellaceae bacterium]|nr:glucosaminidase domain-containing protein [Lewinellaceae bacterium]